jgi:hypothetical protein
VELLVKHALAHLNFLLPEEILKVLLRVALVLLHNRLVNLNVADGALDRLVVLSVLQLEVALGYEEADGGEHAGTVVLVELGLQRVEGDVDGAPVLGVRVLMFGALGFDVWG